jgi:transposase
MGFAERSLWMQLSLSKAECQRLRKAMKRVRSARLFRRLQAVLLAGEGHPAREVTSIVGASRRSVQYWCAAYARRRREPPALALEEKPRLGRTPLFAALNRERLLGEMAKDPLALGYAATNWTVPLLAGHLQRRCGLAVNAHTLRRRLRAAGLRWKRPRFVFAPPEPHPAQKKGR